MGPEKVCSNVEPLSAAPVRWLRGLGAPPLEGVEVKDSDIIEARLPVKVRTRRLVWSSTYLEEGREEGGEGGAYTQQAHQQGVRLG
jgi:hypothetical protein